SEQAREEMGHIFGHVTAAGVADIKRELFGSARAVDRAIDKYLNASYRMLVRLIRALYVAAFGHPRCQGTARISLRGGRLVDPVHRRVQYAEDIHARCTLALATVALEVRCVTTLSDGVAAISHQCCDLQHYRAGPTPATAAPTDDDDDGRERPGSASECGPEDEVPETATGDSACDGQRGAAGQESTESLSTLLADPASASTTAGPHAYARSTTDTLTDARAEAAGATGPKMPAMGVARSLAQLHVLLGDDARLRKRKGEEQQDSPRTKRRKMIHSDDCPPSPHYIPMSPAIAATTPKSRRQLAFTASSGVFPADTPAPPPRPKAKRFTS
ncbi:hypothetical protein H4R19_001444, partial [Coemansia spiralis]